MRSLNDVDSKDLLKKMVPKLQGLSPDLAVGSDAIVHNCHGHPLALTSMANLLIAQHQGRLTGTDCKKASSLLCSHTDNNTLEIFTELRQVLVNSCTDLSVDLKTCLMYTSLFPNGRPVSSKTLTSRWLAEGYIGDETKGSPQEVADEHLTKLMERNIIRPTDESNSGDAKTCKPHSVMHQFMLYKSISSNFIATSLKDRRLSRHLVIENNTNGRDHSTVPVPVARKNLQKTITSWFKFKTSSTCQIELRPRSVAVFGSAEEAVYSDLLKCKLLRVLDIKECRDSLAEHHRDNICKLLHLKYLTLGSSFDNLSVEMKKLHCLETLDLRKTKIEELPEEVISLPHLAHLFGKIKIQRIRGGNFVDKFEKGKSNLQTLAGVVVDNQSVFPRLMGHMKKLRKVTIWCEITSTDSNTYTLLSDAIHKYFEAGSDTPDQPPSLSLHLNYSSEDLLSRPVSSGEGGLLTALKLQLLGRPNQFKEFIESLTFLKELCLTSIDLERGDLQALCTLQRLVCLKLVQDDLKDLHIGAEHFLSLQRLCLVVKESRFPTIAANALPILTSIQLLCGDLEDLGGIKMENLKGLCEVALDSTVDDTTVQLWEDKAEKHPKRPKIVFLKRVDPANTRSAVKYVATDRIPSESLGQRATTDQIPSGTPVQGVPADQISLGPQVQETLIDQILSGPLVQGVVTNGIPSGPPVQAMA